MVPYKNKNTRRDGKDSYEGPAQKILEKDKPPARLLRAEDMHPPQTPLRRVSNRRLLR